ncbi:DHH family phosphoesterase [Chthonobacter rhizosphaerae]|uniref:DHH family phosphoesterase n=1 Tax=Chthonobacter rhizosphaerae TaxID=2735553 RepID=UPI0015EF3DBA|nr:DHH family phosphoesterase [Chthonobacter rhizosphaerae]
MTTGETFRAALSTFGDGPVLIVSHNDADGLSAAAVLSRGLGRAGRPAQIRILGRGETPWSDPIRAELMGRTIGGLVVADLGVRSGPIRPGVPTVVIDHHVPRGMPDDAVVISGHGVVPEPTSSTLAHRAVAALAPAEDLVWLAGLGIAGDMADKAGLPEWDDARKRFGATALRAAATLVNQPRRSSRGDVTPALDLLLTADGPKEIVSGDRPETRALIAARDEVRAELERARRVAPKLAGDVALILFSSGCQVHPLVAQAWAGRLKDRIVLAANAGFRPGWVHFAARTALDVDLVAFLAERAPPGADESYGSGHRKATGGALRIADWNHFVAALGFGAAMTIGE